MDYDPLSPPLQSLPLAFINRVLRSHSWAQKRLQRFCGKTVHLRVSPADLCVSVTPSGEFVSTAQQQSYDVEIILATGALARFIVDRSIPAEHVTVVGDIELAAELRFIAQHAHWDVEEDLSRVFGDVIAHRMVTTGKQLLAWQIEGFHNLARNFAEYWTEEQPLLAKPHQVQTFINDVDALRDDVERLEKRIERFLAGRAEV
ncbi:MAG: ubiquinone biosynthesis accessory factor UbiJ [Burkholderiales bacterium]